MTKICSLGGSLICPEGVDVDFLREFKKIIDACDEQFYISCGGGKFCRKYQAAAKELNPEISSDALDWIGIKTVYVNSELVKNIFSDVHPEVLTPPKKVKEKICILGAEEPGHSTDYNAVLAAIEVGADEVINFTNVDYVYDKDPKEPGAKKIEQMSWEDYIATFGSEWKPGLNAPFDPKAAALASSNGIKVAILNGKNLENVTQLLEGKSFKGTLLGQ